jgi:hypothetical protein
MAAQPMRLSLKHASGVLAILSVFSAGGISARAEQQPAATSAATASSNSVEDIYILRSVREKRDQPTEACATARSKLAEPAWEDHYTFRSVATRSSDGRVLDANVAPVGTIRACFGRTADPAVFELYGDLEIHGIAGKAFGKCHSGRSDFPEQGLKLFACQFALFDLPPAYLGGQLTTNSISSLQLFGTQSDPPGYAQVSIATIRLWKKRPVQ